MIGVATVAAGISGALMDRRSFLRQAAVAGSAVIAGGTAAGCSSPGPRPSEGPAPSSGKKEHDGGPPDWQALAGSLVGAVLLPGDAGYPAAGHLYNSVYTPDAAAIAQCASASDVQRCIAFARTHDVQVAAHSGGHSYGGYSSCPGLVIDVSHLQGISVGGTGAGGAATPGSERSRSGPAPS